MKRVKRENKPPLSSPRCYYYMKLMEMEEFVDDRKVPKDNMEEEGVQDEKLSDNLPLGHALLLWQAVMPLKIKIFLWQASRGRLPATDQIRKRNGPGSDRCAPCGQ